MLELELKLELELELENVQQKWKVHEKTFSQVVGQLHLAKKT